jgi:F-box domain
MIHRMKESAAKKIKLSNELSDPFAGFNQKLIAHIFQHLSGKDILSLSEVSKGWKRFVSSSPAVMNRFKINLHQDAAFKESKRQYRNIDIELRDPSSSAQKLLLLKRFAPSIVDLKIPSKVYQPTFPSRNSKFWIFEAISIRRDSLFRRYKMLRILKNCRLCFTT